MGSLASSLGPPGAPIVLLPMLSINTSSAPAHSFGRAGQYCCYVPVSPPPPPRAVAQAAGQEADGPAAAALHCGHQPTYQAGGCCLVVPSPHAKQEGAVYSIWQGVFSTSKPAPCMGWEGWSTHSEDSTRDSILGIPIMQRRNIGKGQEGSFAMTGDSAWLQQGGTRLS